MPLVENGQIVEDRYVRVADDAPIPDRVPVIVSAKRFLAEADALIRPRRLRSACVAERPHASRSSSRGSATWR